VRAAHIAERDGAGQRRATRTRDAADDLTLGSHGRPARRRIRVRRVEAQADEAVARAAARLHARHDLLTRVAALREAYRAADEPGLGGQHVLAELGALRRRPRFDPQHLERLRIAGLERVAACACERPRDGVRRRCGRE